ncbi:uncharacterized protein FIESC28_02457 [Fusarium coffeatum]|uniref:NACHT domain-containing protein n=1 Tax=Fusarium coffeatum TaxID=231269 RepID=A0A366S5T6_9HYPO|nr:uncharacterized protein FIESC28_02457 [Fusarium coffeatum]RBR24684.1 hypothetical protein FIESC28_02457 [Fusarium coffeatum]
MSTQLDQFNLAKSTHQTTSQIYNAVQDQKKVLQDSSDRETRRIILDWVSNANYSQKHWELQSSRVKDTGTWILQTDEYIRWRDDPATSNVLFCHGIQGSGKTNLVSFIIDDLISSDSSQPFHTAFFYFDHQDRHRQGALAVLSSILRQLLENLPELPESLAQLHKTLSPRGQLSLHDCQSIMTNVATNLGSVYLVLDALDECASEQRKVFLQSIGQVSQLQNVRLLVTSHPHIQDLAEIFGHCPTLEIKAQEGDIKMYLDHELDRQSISYRADPDFAERLVKKLTEGAEGMFLLPVLQLRTVLQQPTQGDMEDKLEHLSHSLGGAFEDAITRIQGLQEGYSRIGMEILMWLAHAARPLTLSEVSDALAIQKGRKAVNAKYRPGARVIIESCQGLVIVDSEGYIRVAHHAIQEYVDAHQEVLFPHAQGIIACKCLQYLLFQDFEEGPWSTKDEIESRMQSYPFLEYTARYWGQHTRESESHVEVQSTLFTFFTSLAATASANQVYHYSLGRRKLYWNSAECKSCTPLHHSSRHGLEHAVATLLGNGMQDVNELTRMGSTPIIMAAGTGHVPTVKLLLERGANPYLSNWYGNALHCAVEAGRSDVIELLISWGMDPNESMGNRTFLACALDRDSVDAVETLVNMGANLEAQHREYPCHLFFDAAFENCEKIIDLFIQRSWVDIEMKDRYGHSAMHHATMGVAIGVTKKLIEAGSDINGLDGIGKTPLDHATATGNHVIIKLLAESGAKIKVEL